MTPSASPLRQLGLAEPARATVFRRPVGSLGPQDFDQVPETAVLEGVYAVQGTQVACEHLKTCADEAKPYSITIELRNCSRTQCTLAAPKNYWAGEFPFTAAGGRWSGTGPTWSATGCRTCRTSSGRG